MYNHVRLANGDKVQTLGQVEMPLDISVVGSTAQKLVTFCYRICVSYILLNM